MSTSISIYLKIGPLEKLQTIVSDYWRITVAALGISTIALVNVPGQLSGHHSPACLLDILGAIGSTLLNSPLQSLALLAICACLLPSSRASAVASVSSWAIHGGFSKLFFGVVTVAAATGTPTSPSPLKYKALQPLGSHDFGCEADCSSPVARNRRLGRSHPLAPHTHTKKHAQQQHTTSPPPQQQRQPQQPPPSPPSAPHTPRQLSRATTASSPVPPSPSRSSFTLLRLPRISFEIPPFNRYFLDSTPSSAPTTPLASSSTPSPLRPAPLDNSDARSLDSYPLDSHDDSETTTSDHHSHHSAPRTSLDATLPSSRRRWQPSMQRILSGHNLHALAHPSPFTPTFQTASTTTSEAAHFTPSSPSSVSLSFPSPESTTTQTYSLSASSSTLAHSPAVHLSPPHSDASSKLPLPSASGPTPPPSNPQGEYQTTCDRRSDWRSERSDGKSESVQAGIAVASLQALVQGQAQVDVPSWMQEDPWGSQPGEDAIAAVLDEETERLAHGREGDIHTVITGTNLIQMAAALGEPAALAAISSGAVPLPCGPPESCFLGLMDSSYEKGEWELVCEGAQAGSVRTQGWRRHLRNGLYMYKSRTVYEGVTTQQLRAFQHLDLQRAEWDDSIISFDFLPTTSTSSSHSTPPPTHSETAFLQSRMKFPKPLASREYVYARRVWPRSCDGGCYGVSRSCSHAAAAQATGRAVRVADFASAYIIRGVPEARAQAMGITSPCAEVQALYFEDSQVRPGIINLAIKKGMWGVVQRTEAMLRKYLLLSTPHTLHAPSPLPSPSTTAPDARQPITPFPVTITDESEFTTASSRSSSFNDSFFPTLPLAHYASCPEYTSSPPSSPPSLCQQLARIASFPLSLEPNGSHSSSVAATGAMLCGRLARLASYPLALREGSSDSEAPAPLALAPAAAAPAAAAAAAAQLRSRARRLRDLSHHVANEVMEQMVGQGVDAA